MSIEVTDELVANIANLARLSLTSEESREMKAHFEKILKFVAELEELDLGDVDPSNFALDASSVQRADEIAPSLDPEAGLANAPLRDGSSFVVPAIIAGPGDGDPGDGNSDA